MKGVITYHSIDDSGSVISVAPSTFRDHMASLASAGVPVRTLAQIVAPTCESGVALTFDDGFENFASEAWPVLREFEFPATLFVVTDYMGRYNDWDQDDPRIPHLPLMSWDTVKDFTSQGLELGGHTCSHPDLRSLASLALREEVVDSRRTIEHRTGVRPTSFAYPYGLYGADGVAAVARAGYSVAVTTELMWIASGTDPLEVPRLDAYYLQHPGSLKSWGTRSFRRYVRLRRTGRRIRRFMRQASSS